MSTTKKVLISIFSILFIGAFAFALTWGIINFQKVKEGMSGTGLYTQEDVDNAYQDGYDTALTDKSEYDRLMNEYRDTITNLNDQVSQLNSSISSLQNNIKDYQSQVSSLQSSKSELEGELSDLQNTITQNNDTIKQNNEKITQYEQQIEGLKSQLSGKDAYEAVLNEKIKSLNSQIDNLTTLNKQLEQTNQNNLQTISLLNSQIIKLNEQIGELSKQVQSNGDIVNSLNAQIAQLQKSIEYYENYIQQLESGDQIVVTFEFDGSVYNIQILQKNGKASVVQPSGDKHIVFNYWMVDGVQIDLNSYSFSKNTKVVANVTYYFDVKFMVDNDQYDDVQLVVKDGFATNPTNPSKQGYEFDGWTINGSDIVDVTSQPVTENVVYIAKFTKLHTVTFKYEEQTKSTQQIKNGEHPSNVEVESTDKKIFNGWTLNGVIVNVEEQVIYSDTEFVADITYYFDLTFEFGEQSKSFRYLNGTNILIYDVCNAKDFDPIPHKVFKGWALDGENVYSKGIYYKVSQDIIFKAVFDDVVNVTINYTYDNATRENYLVNYSQQFEVNENTYLRDLKGISFNSGSYTFAQLLSQMDGILGYNFNGFKSENTVYTGNELMTEDLVLTANLEKQTFNELSWADIDKLCGVSRQDMLFSLADSEKHKSVISRWLNVGDERDIRLKTGENVTIVVLDFDKDIITYDTYFTTYRTVTFGFKNLLKREKLDTVQLNTSPFEQTYMVTVLNEVYNNLPDEVAAVVKGAQKKTLSSSSKNCYFNLWLFSMVELNGTTEEGYKDEGSQYEYYKTHEYAKKYSESDVDYSEYWLRTKDLSNSTNYRLVGRGNFMTTTFPTFEYGICCGFCI